METAEPAPGCVRCGAPIPDQPSVIADSAEGGPSDPIRSPAGDDPHQPASQRPASGDRRNALVLAGLGLVLLVAVTVLVWSVTTIVARLNSPTSSTSSGSSATSSASTSAPPPLAVEYVDYYGLQTGNCLTGSDLRLSSSNSWPDEFNVVPCTQPHLAEVFFAADPWPLTMAYPGDATLDNVAQNRCDSAFAAYDGISVDQSTLTVTDGYPDSDTWSTNDDRFLLCIAYDSTTQYPDGAPSDHSIKGSQQ